MFSMVVIGGVVVVLGIGIDDGLDVATGLVAGVGVGIIVFGVGVEATMLLSLLITSSLYWFAVFKVLLVADDAEERMSSLWDDT